MIWTIKSNRLHLPLINHNLQIDMEAFLLLDEQNLKDIGVSTMGARKKIYNAILSELFGKRKFSFSIQIILYT